MTSGTSGVWVMPGHYFVFRYTVNLYNGRRSSSVDPVPADAVFSVTTGSR
jgi:hypothetical protein